MWFLKSQIAENDQKNERTTHTQQHPIIAIHRLHCKKGCQVLVKNHSQRPQKTSPTVANLAQSVSHSVLRIHRNSQQHTVKHPCSMQNFPANISQSGGKTADVRDRISDNRSKLSSHRKRNS